MLVEPIHYTPPLYFGGTSLRVPRIASKTLYPPGGTLVRIPLYSFTRTSRHLLFHLFFVGQTKDIMGSYWVSLPRVYLKDYHVESGTETCSGVKLIVKYLQVRVAEIRTEKLQPLLGVIITYSYSHLIPPIVEK